MLNIDSFLIPGEEIKYCANWDFDEIRYSLYITNNRIIHIKDTKNKNVVFSYRLNYILGTTMENKYHNNSFDTLKILYNNDELSSEFNTRDTKLMYEIQHEITKAINL